MFRNLQSLRQSFANAIQGFVFAMAERNFFIQVIIAVIVISASFLFRLSVDDKIIIFLLCSIVMIVELINTAIEKMLDKIISEFHEDVKVIKDIMAASVLLASLGALIAGLLIFWRAIM